MRVDTTGLLEEGEELVAGRHPVQEAFAAGRAALRLLVVPERRAALEALVLHATTLRIPVIEVEGGTLTSLSGFDGHQGVALVVEPRTAANIEDILALARQRGERPFVLVLDSLEDPQNLGTLLRSAEACAVHGVVYPARRAVPLTAAAVKASAGASEHLLLAPVADLAGAIADLRGHGLRAVGADQEAALPYTQADLRGPLALVVGSEGFGISGQLRRRLDMTVRIPMRGKVGSLNAAVAGSVLLFAAAEGRGRAELRSREGNADLISDPPVSPAATEPAAPEPGAGPENAAAADSAARPKSAISSVEPDELLPGGPAVELGATPEDGPAVESAEPPKGRVRARRNRSDSSV